mgnify:FL=1
MGDGNLYRGSDGCYYGDVDIWEQFESGSWTPCCWNTETGTEWVETSDGELLRLVPVSQRSSSAEPHVEHVRAGLRVVSRPSKTR